MWGCGSPRSTPTRKRLGYELMPQIKGILLRSINTMYNHPHVCLLMRVTLGLPNPICLNVRSCAHPETKTAAFLCRRSSRRRRLLEAMTEGHSLGSILGEQGAPQLSYCLGQAPYLSLGVRPSLPESTCRSGRRVDRRGQTLQRKQWRPISRHFMVEPASTTARNYPPADPASFTAFSPQNAILYKPVAPNRS